MESPSPILVLVQSRLRSPALPSSTFHKWYNTAHIPDLLQTPGVSSGLRYLDTRTPSDEDATVAGTFPYLALYPGLERAWLTSKTCEFLKVPLHHDMLPGPSHFVFEFADFVIGAYVARATLGEEGVGVPGCVVFGVAEEGVVEEKGVGRVLADSRAQWEAEGAVMVGKSAVLEWDFSPAGAKVRKEEIDKGMLLVGSRFLVVVSFALLLFRG